MSVEIEALETVIARLKKRQKRSDNTSGVGARVASAILASKIADLELQLLVRKPKEEKQR